MLIYPGNSLRRNGSPFALRTWAGRTVVTRPDPLTMQPLLERLISHLQSGKRSERAESGTGPLLAIWASKSRPDLAISDLSRFAPVISLADPPPVFIPICIQIAFHE